jgi:hypothetical protein
MNVVADSTGMAPVGELSYPLGRIIDLADVFVPERDGGLLKRTGASWTRSIAPSSWSLSSLSSVFLHQASSWTYTFKRHNQVKKLGAAATFAEADFRGVGRRSRFSGKCVSRELA